MALPQFAGLAQMPMMKPSVSALAMSKPVTKATWSVGYMFIKLFIYF